MCKKPIVKRKIDKEELQMSLNSAFGQMSSKVKVFFGMILNQFKNYDMVSDI